MNELIVKDNALINAGYNLSLVEQRLILLAIVNARESGKGITANDPLTIRADAYINQFDVHRTTAYQALKDACKDLFMRQFSYQKRNAKGHVTNMTSRWVSEIGYTDNEASVLLVFAPAVVPLIVKLEEEFTKYDIEQISKLSSAYAVRLYELLIAWRSTCKTPVFDLAEFKKKLGVVNGEYQRIELFKRRVLNPAIEQINEHTDIKASYEQHKKGRKITGFSFTFTFKKAAKSPKQKQHYTKADLDKNPGLALPGESYEQALKRLNSRNGLLGTEEEQAEIKI